MRGAIFGLLLRISALFVYCGIIWGWLCGGKGLEEVCSAVRVVRDEAGVGGRVYRSTMFCRERGGADVVFWGELFFCVEGGGRD